MARPVLKKDSEDEAVFELQDLLNRTGALLVVDGDFGKNTERAVKEAQEMAGLPVTGVADQPTWDWLEAQPVPCLDLTTSDVTFVVREEVGGRDYYEKVTAFPHCPGEESGVTIGIGYDLRFQGPDNFEADWGAELRPEDMEKLKPHLGVKGSEDAVTGLRSIKVPFTSAWRVFLKQSLPRYLEDTRAAYPQFDDLPDGCKGVLLSLVYNRGTSMDADKDSRREMKTIQSCLAAGDYVQVADEIASMKRLWPNSKGLRDRRDREAELWRRGLERAGLA